MTSRYQKRKDVWRNSSRTLSMKRRPRGGLELFALAYKREVSSYFIFWFHLTLPFCDSTIPLAQTLHYVYCKYAAVAFPNFADNAA